jgi:hypothetical protein
MPRAFPYRDIGLVHHCPLPNCGERILVGEKAVWWRRPDVMAHEQCVARDWRERSEARPAGIPVHYDWTTSDERGGRT